MAVCPACGIETSEGASECPGCRLSTSLFSAVREAAGPAGENDPAYVRTVAELLQSVDLAGAPAVASPPVPALLDQPSRFPPMPPPALVEELPVRATEPLAPLHELPALPPASSGAEVRRRAEEYTSLARRLGLDFSGLGARLAAASLAQDDPSLDTVAREMFVHLLSALAAEFDTELARRNEIAQHFPTPAADVELAAIRRSLGLGDLTGAHRRLVHVRDELGQLQQQWEAGRILLAECELLDATVRELGGDPAPALGPLAAGRSALATGRREPAERLLARAAFALWAVLEPRFLDDLKRLRDRLAEERAAGADVGPALAELRGMAVELKRRNFGGAIGAYRRLRGTVERWEPPTASTPTPPVAAGGERPDPSGTV
jgi:hypothetical protein